MATLTPIIVTHRDRSCRITLNDKWMKKPFADGVVAPFVKSANKRNGWDLTLDSLKGCTIDGVEVAVEEIDAPSRSLLTAIKDQHAVVLVFDDEAPPGDPVERVMAAGNEFETLGLAAAAVETSVVRRQYKKVSLVVHPDKSASPRAEEAFKKVFAAMKVLMDPVQQRAALRKAKGGGGGGGGEDLPEEFKWWQGTSVSEMEQAFRNLEEYLDAKGAFGEQRVDDNLWVDPGEAAEAGCVFVDARDVRAYVVSRVPGAMSLPGHTMTELEALTRHHPVIKKLSHGRDKRIVVYSDNGSMLSRCVHVARALRATLPDPERVRRLKGGLNGWKRLGFEVQGDERAMFAGKAAADPRLQS